DENVGELAVAGLIVLDADSEGALQHADDRVEIAFADRLKRKADGDDDIGVHGFYIGRRQVLKDGAVDELVAVELKRTKDTGNGSGGPNCVLQRPAAEGDSLGVIKIGCLAAKWDRKRIEIGLVVVGEELPVEHLVEAGIGEQ